MSAVDGRSFHTVTMVDAAVACLAIQTELYTHTCTLYTTLTGVARKTFPAANGSVGSKVA